MKRRLEDVDLVGVAGGVICALSLLLSNIGFPSISKAIVSLVAGLLFIVASHFYHKGDPLRPFGIAFRCLAPVAVGVLFVDIYIALHQISEGPVGSSAGGVVGAAQNVIKDIIQWAHVDNYKELFYTAMATLFAIVLALALVKGMEEIGRGKGYIEEEASGIYMASILLRYFEDDELKLRSRAAKARILNNLKRYAQACSERADREKSSGNFDIIRQCQQCLINIWPADDDDLMAKAELIRLLDKLAIWRLRRIDFFETRMHGFVLFALWSMSLAMLLPFLAQSTCLTEAQYQAELAKTGFSQAVSAKMSREDGKTKLAEGASSETAGIACPPGYEAAPQRFSQYYMIFVIAAFLSFMMFMLHDVNRSAFGFWRVDMSAYGNVLEALKKEEEEEKKRKRKERERKKKREEKKVRGKEKWTVWVKAADTPPACFEVVPCETTSTGSGASSNPQGSSPGGDNMASDMLPPLSPSEDDSGHV